MNAMQTVVFLNMIFYTWFALVVFFNHIWLLFAVFKIVSNMQLCDAPFTILIFFLLYINFCCAFLNSSNFKPLHHWFFVVFKSLFLFNCIYVYVCNRCAFSVQLPEADVYSWSDSSKATPLKKLLSSQNQTEMDWA